MTRRIMSIVAAFALLITFAPSVTLAAPSVPSKSNTETPAYVPPGFVLVDSIPELDNKFGRGALVGKANSDGTFDYLYVVQGNHISVALKPRIAFYESTLLWRAKGKQYVTWDAVYTVEPFELTVTATAVDRVVAGPITFLASGGEVVR